MSTRSVPATLFAGLKTKITAPHLLIGIMILAALLRLLHLGTESFWMDEIASVAIAHLNWGTFWKAVSHVEANMVLYYSLLHFWVKLGESEVIVRSLSALAGWLTVPVIYVLGGRMFGTRVALISALLLAANAFHIKFSQEARAYTLVVLLTTVSSLFFIKAIERNSRTDWAGYVVTGTLAVYSHFFAVLVVGAQLPSLILLPPRDVPWKRLLVSISVMILLLVPLAIFVFTRDQGQLGAVPKLRPSEVYGLFDSFAGGGKLLVLAYFAPCLIAFLHALQAWSRCKMSRETWRYGFFLSWLLVPILIGLAVSVFKPVLVARYFIICLPALVMLAAVGTSSINSGWIRASTLVVLLVLSGHAVLFYYSHPEKEDWRAATDYVVSHTLQKDGILFYIDTGRLGFDYYVRRLGLAGQTWDIAFPESFDWEGRKPENWPDDSELALSERYRRVWLFLSHVDVMPMRQQKGLAIEASLARQYPDVREKRFRGVRVVLFQQR
jgi:mannosyltransferase